MRIAPARLFFHDSPDLYEQARASASVTHAHPVGVDGAAVLAWAVAQAVKLAPQEPFPSEHFSQGLVDFARTLQIRDKVVLVRILIAEDVPASDAARCLGAAWPCTNRCPLPSTHFCAILHGGDQDTLGAMACAVSEAYLGVEAIPQGWREKAENR